MKAYIEHIFQSVLASTGEGLSANIIDFKYF